MKVQLIINLKNQLHLNYKLIKLIIKCNPKISIILTYIFINALSSDIIIHIKIIFITNRDIAPKYNNNNNLITN